MKGVEKRKKLKYTTEDKVKFLQTWTKPEKIPWQHKPFIRNQIDISVKNNKFFRILTPIQDIDEAHPRKYKPSPVAEYKRKYPEVQIKKFDRLEFDM